LNCNFSLVKLDGCRLQDIQFIDCKITGAEFFKCEKMFFSASFKNCLLQYCNFSDLSMKDSSFCGSKVKESHFTNTMLKGADFSDVDLSGTIFHNCDLCHADFSSALHYDIDPRTNKIKKAKFSFPAGYGLLRAFDITIV
jgi:fluoroquinolone resistance protein